MRSVGLTDIQLDSPLHLIWDGTVVQAQADIARIGVDGQRYGVVQFTMPLTTAQRNALKDFILNQFLPAARVSEGIS